MKIAIVASNNGLGHIRRAALLANKLTKKFKITILCSVDKIKKFKLDKAIKIKEFNIELYKNKILQKKNNIHNYFNLKEKFDLYLSDNYPEITLKKDNSLMLSNFFWHDILKINTNYYKNVEKKIRERPVIANYLFVSKYIKKNFKIRSVGFYGNFKNRSIKNSRNGILISFGTAEMKNKNYIQSFINQLKNHKKRKFPIYLEPKFYQKDFEKYNLFKATYDDKMYNKVAIAIIKPGLGTITECLSRGISIFTFTRGQNKEFLFNAQVLEKNHLGINFNYLSSAIEFACLMVSDVKFLKKKYDLAKKLQWNGEFEVIKIIEELFKNKILILNNRK